MNLKIAASLILILSSLNGVEVSRAAFDIGSGEIRVTAADVDLNHERITKILLQSYKKVELLKELSKSSDNCLSEKIQCDLVDAIKELKEKVNNVCKVDQWSAIGTSVFRGAKNGAEVLQKVEEETGIKVVLLSQEMEGEIGFTSAVGVSGESPESIISWDSGAGSFQISESNDGKLSVYGNEFAYLAALEILFVNRGQEFSPAISFHPVYFDEAEQLIKDIGSRLPVVPDWLANTNKNVVGVGRDCLFSVASTMLGKKTFIKEEVKALIDGSCGKTDSEFEGRPPMVALILLYSVMDHCGINEVTFCKTNGSAEGVLITKDLWQ